MKILIAGDFVPQGKTANLIDTGLYNKIFSEVKPLTAEVDYSIVNLEAPIIKGQPTPILKSGPNLYCSKNTMDAVKYAGFNCVTLANNHFYDQGDQGVRDTLKECKLQGIDFVGGGYNLQEASTILYRQIGKETLAIINCCEKEFSIATDHHGGSNPLEPVRIYYSIKEAKQKAEYVLLITHGGIEQYPLPYPQMQELYRFFIDAGADAIVNHHQHCYSGYEIYKSKPIFYGIGNFCFEHKIPSQKWEEGYVTILDISKSDISWEIKPYCQSKNCEPGIHFLNVPNEISAFDLGIEKLNQIIVSDIALHNEFISHLMKIGENRLEQLEPIKNNFVRRLRAHHLFPSFIKDHIIAKYYVYMQCTAHNNVLSAFIKDRIGNKYNSL